MPVAINVARPHSYQAQAIASAKGSFFIKAKMDPALFFNLSAHPVAMGVLQYGSDMGPVLKKLPKPFNMHMTTDKVCRAKVDNLTLDALMTAIDAVALVVDGGSIGMLPPIATIHHYSSRSACDLP